MKKSQLLRALQAEIRRYTFDYFVENPPSVAKGGKGVVVPGCPACREVQEVNCHGRALGVNPPPS